MSWVPLLVLVLRVDALARLGSIDREGPTPEDRLTYELLEKDLRFAIEDHGFRRYLLPLDQRSGVHTASELVDLLRFQTVKDYEDWLSRLRALPARQADHAPGGATPPPEQGQVRATPADRTEPEGAPRQGQRPRR